MNASFMKQQRGSNSVMSIHVDNDAGPSNPFILDATSHPDISTVPLIHTVAVRKFLSKDSELLGIAAEKGIGKTHLLRLKSKQLRDSSGADAIWIPKTELCEQFERITYAFNTKQAHVYADLESWKVLWSTSIATVILARAGVPLPEQLLGLLFKGSKLASTEDLTIESCLLSLLAEDLEGFRLLYGTRLKNLITNKIDRKVGVFIDSIDEAFDKHVGETLWDATNKLQGSGRQGVVKESIWVSAQLGLVAAARDLQRANRHVGVYFAVRREALNANRSALALQELSLIQDLRYSAETAKDIFLSRVNVVPTSRLADSNAHNALDRFLGFDSIPHWLVKDKDGMPVSEDAFQFLYRHTFGRVRELLHLGNLICDMEPHARTQSTVRGTVYDWAQKFFEAYRREMIPFWDRRYEEVFSHITSNVLTQSQLNGVFTRINGLSSAPSHPFCYLYGHGLLGRIESNRDAKRQISFVGPGMYLLDQNQHLPVSSHYFLHPCLESTVKERSMSFKIDDRLIVGDGNGCDLEEQPAPMEIKWRERDSFGFFYQGTDLRYISPQGGAIYALIFAIIALTAATTGASEVSSEQMIAMAERLIDKGLVSAQPPRANKLQLLDVLRKLDRNKEDTGKTYRREIVERIRKSLSEAYHEVPAAARPEEFGGDSLLGYRNGSFVWRMCEPSEINVVDVVRHLHKPTSSS